LKSDSKAWVGISAGSADEYEQASDRGLRAPPDPGSHMFSSPEADEGFLQVRDHPSAASTLGQAGRVFGL